nr:hypothetical protein [Kibdelosporangium sp. MJ126-NF4]CEL15752.1 hypothetical protein [Kibdelosporangium sp. MJ126-NF4]CTQ93678.1 hypothetical protein [Kibdelosporangium sp. MJ126-NF4]
MSEQELREGLRLAVADEPPMDFDLDELVTTAERLVRRRRALVTVGVSTAAVAVVAVTIPVVLGIGGGSVEIPVAAPPNQSQTPTATATYTAELPPPSEAQLRQRAGELKTYLKTQVPAVVANAKSVVVEDFGGEATGQFSPGQNYLDGFVKFKLGTVSTAVAVQVRTDQTDEQQCGNCPELPQQDGSKVKIQLENGGTGNDSAMTILTASHFRTDGTITKVTTYNYDPTTQVKPVYQQNVALTQDQLVRLATDPAVHI